MYSDPVIRLKGEYPASYPDLSLISRARDQLRAHHSRFTLAKKCEAPEEEAGDYSHHEHAYDVIIVPNNIFRKKARNMTVKSARNVISPELGLTVKIINLAIASLAFARNNLF